MVQAEISDALTSLPALSLQLKPEPPQPLHNHDRAAAKPGRSLLWQELLAVQLIQNPTRS